MLTFDPKFGGCHDNSFVYPWFGSAFVLLPKYEIDIATMYTVTAF